MRSGSLRRQNRERLEEEAASVGSTLAVARWILKDLFQHHRVAVAQILTLEILGAFGVGASLAAIFGLSQMTADQAPLLPSPWGLSLPYSWKPYLTIALGILGILSGLAIYKAHKMSVAVAAARFSTLHQQVIAIVSSSQLTGWQSAVMPQVNRGLKQIFTSGIKSVGKASLRVLKLIYPAAILVAALTVLIFTAPGIALVLLPFGAAYVLYLTRMNRQVGSLFRSDDKAFRSYRRTLNTAMTAAAKDGPVGDAASTLSDADTTQVGELLLRRKSITEKIRNLNSGAFFLVVLFLFFYLTTASPQTEFTASHLVFYFILLGMVFKALDALLSTFLLLYRNSGKILPLKQLLEYEASEGGRTPGPRKPGSHTGTPSSLSLRGFDYQHRSKGALSLSAGTQVMVLLDEAVNRFSLPAVCLLIEEWAGLSRCSLLDKSAFIYDEGDLESATSADSCRFVTDGVRFDQLASDGGYITFWVTNDAGHLFAKEPPAGMTNETLCMASAGGRLLGFGPRASFRDYRSSIVKALKKSRHALGVDDDEDDE